jgi:polyphosphate kinase
MEATHAAIPDEMRAILLMPPQLRRFVALPAAAPAEPGAPHEAPLFVLVEDMLSHIELDGFFPERELREHGMFRVLRDSEVEVDEEAVDLVRMFEVALKRRRKGVAIRLDVDADMPVSMREWLATQMNVQPARVVVVDGLVGLGDVSQIISEAAAAAAASGFPRANDLVFPPFKERMPERVTREAGGIFAAIRQKDIIVHHPFESFNTVLLFVRAAAADPDVVAIKQTLYRTSENSPIVQSLIEAAESGKTVTALIELKARFDEEANIRWAKDMERAGVHVVYGFRELKTHAKISLVVRREAGGLQSYVHMVSGDARGVGIMRRRVRGSLTSPPSPSSPRATTTRRRPRSTRTSPSLRRTTRSRATRRGSSTSARATRSRRSRTSSTCRWRP